MHSSFVAVHNADASTEPGWYEEPRRHPMKKMSVHNFRSDPMFPRIERAVAEQLAKGNVVAPVGVLIGMGLLRPEHLADWRRGRVAYLEHVINCNLSRLSRLLRILRFHAHDLNLKPSLTVYKRHGKGPKQQLRFSKTGDPNLEAAYATHLIRPGHRPLPVSDQQSTCVAGPHGSAKQPDRCG
jgi:hypothetical protein